MTTGQEAPAQLADLALGSLHDELGARWVAEDGVAVPADYGDAARELEALREGHAVVDLSWAGRLELRGRDRHRFLNGLVTSNTKDLKPGRGVYGFVLSKQGRVLADVYVTALEDRLWLELPAGTGDRVRQHLEGYRVIDDVEVASLDDLALLGVLGPAAGLALGEPARSLALDATTRARIEGCEVQLTRRRVLGVEGFVLWAPSSLAREIFAGLAEAPPKGAAASPSAAGRAAGLRALDARRIEAGVGRWGVDFDQDAVANETGLVDAAIDFTKGCYLGQEIVARIHYRGQASALCCPLEITGRPDAPALPSTLRSAAAEGAPGKVSGTLTSVAAGRGSGSWLGIGTLARRALDAGAPLLLDGGGVVTPRQPER
jgi:tRNA-modifying protein YgfZ